MPLIPPSTQLPPPAGLPSPVRNQAPEPVVTAAPTAGVTTPTQDQNRAPALEQGKARPQLDLYGDDSSAGRFIAERGNWLTAESADLPERIENVPGSDNRWRHALKQAGEIAKARDGIQLWIRAGNDHGGDGSLRLATLKDSKAPLRQLLAHDAGSIRQLSVLLDNGAEIKVRPDGQLDLPRLDWQHLSDRDTAFLLAARDAGLIADPDALQQLESLKGPQLSRKELAPYLPSEAPAWLKSLAGIAGTLTAFEVSQYEAYDFHPEKWREAGRDPYPALTAPNTTDGSLSRENNNPLALLKGGGSGGHFLNTAQLVMLYRQLGDAVATGADALVPDGDNTPEAAKVKADLQQLLQAQQQKLQGSPAALEALAEHLGQTEVAIQPGAGPDQARLRQQLQELQLPAPAIDAYLETVNRNLKQLEAPGLSKTDAKAILQRIDAATTDLAQQAGKGQKDRIGPIIGQAGKEFMAGYMAHRTLTTMGEIIEVSHNIGGAFRNLPFPLFDVQPQDENHQPIKHSHSINDLGDRIANASGVAALYLQEWLDPGGYVRVFSASPFATNSGGSFTPTFAPLPDFPNIRPSFTAGIEVGVPGGGVSLASVVNTATGSGGLAKGYTDHSLGMTMAAGRHSLDMCYDPLASHRLAPFMGPSTSMMDIGAYIEPNYFLKTTSPFVQNSRLDFNVLTRNPSSPGQQGEHLTADGSVAPDQAVEGFKAYRMRYTLPMSNVVPRCDPGWLNSGTFFNGFAENTRFGMSAAYIDSAPLPPGQNPRSAPGFKAAPYLNTNLLNVSGNEGSTFWEDVAVGALRFVLSSTLQTGVNAGYRALGGE